MTEKKSSSAPRITRAPRSLTGSGWRREGVREAQAVGGPGDEVYGVTSGSPVQLGVANMTATVITS